MDLQSVNKENKQPELASTSLKSERRGRKKLLERERKVNKGGRRTIDEAEEENMVMESNNRSETRDGGGENKKSEGNTSLCFCARPSWKNKRKQ